MIQETNRLVKQDEMAKLMNCCGKHVYNLWKRKVISRVEGLGRLVRYDPKQVFGELGLEWNE